jgi:RNA ligase (TIGR02306 family)
MGDFMRKLATIQRILGLEKHPNADTLEIAKLNDVAWSCLVKKGEFKIGDLVVFLEIDSLLPELPEWEFLKDKKYRIKTIKLRGVISQGLIMPLSVLEGKKFPDDTRENPTYEWKEGMDISAILGVKKYESYIPPNLAGEIKGNFPGFIPKSDETRIQILRPLLEKYKGTKCYISEKIDGSSCTFFIKDGEFGVCSRNLELKETPENSIWKLARKYNIESNLKQTNRNIAIQAEIVGPGINKNTLKLNTVDLYFFNAFDIDSQKYLDLTEFKVLIENILKLKIVPIIKYDYVLEDKIDKLIENANGESSINKEGPREGIVIRPIKEIVDNTLENLNFSRVSFKVINPEYLLKYE